MKVIIAGSRTITDYQAVREAIESSGFRIREVVSGHAKGVDTLGEFWAYSQHIPLMQFPAEWEKYGNMAGPIRNREMAEYADALILVWDGKSHGSANMLKTAKEHGLKIYEKVI